MRINNITPLFALRAHKKDMQKEQASSVTNPNLTRDNRMFFPMFNDHLIAFQAQVDKGLERFYEVNKENMPLTVLKYINSMEDKSSETPLEAQRNAFIKLEDAETVSDIKRAYPKEPLFFDLKDLKHSKATRGIINVAKKDGELFELYGIGALKDKKDLTVYLVQKIFNEAKTIDEINEDLEQDLDKDFKADFKAKNPDSKYIYPSTLKSLGIQTPNFAYQQSLRYTRAGYSDEVGAKIQQSLQTFWDSMSEADRTARAKKSVTKFENWWKSIPNNQKLEMLADQVTALELLKSYNKAERAKEKLERKNAPEVENSAENDAPRKHVKVGSQKLKNDELFVKWATYNLKMFNENLSEAEKDTLHIKRVQRLSARWASMTPAEKTDYINKMKSGSEPLKYTMIDAWNNSKDLIKELSNHLRANQIYKPSDLLYSTEEFSEFQSRVMTEFWQSHKDMADALGTQIQRSQEKINLSIQRGTFEELKKQIVRDKHQRIKELASFKYQQTYTPQKTTAGEGLEYIDEFKDLYLKMVGPRLKNIPSAYMDEYFDSIKTLPKEYVLSWNKTLRGEPINEQDEQNLHKLTQSDSEGVLFSANRALEATLANVIYEHTKNPVAYQLSFSDLKTALYQLESHHNPLEFHSLKLREDFILPVRKEKININKADIANRYKEYRKPLSETEINNIIHYYYSVDKENLEDLNSFDKVLENTEALKNYMRKFNRSLLIPFSDRSTFPPEIKMEFYKKFLLDTPKEIMAGPLKPFLKSSKDFQEDSKFMKAKLLLMEKYRFLPRSFFDSYFPEVARVVRSKQMNLSVDYFIDTVCQKRRSAAEPSKMMLFNKNQLLMDNKLKSIAMEQALADVLYDSTDNEQVYSLILDELCDNFEILSLVNRFPTVEKECQNAIGDNHFSYVAKRRPNFNKIESKYNEYMELIEDWKKENLNKSEKPDFEDLLYILNPEEGNINRDMQVARRMGCYGIAPEKFTVNPN